MIISELFMVSGKLKAKGRLFFIRMLSSDNGRQEVESKGIFNEDQAN